MKSFTDIEQSKKLTEILPIKSADMVYIATADDEIGDTLYTAEIKSEIIIDNDDDYIQCWSLAALLQVLPIEIYDELDDRDYELEINMADKMPRYVRLGDTYHSKFPYDFEKDTLLDNIVESIIWLNDNNYFEL